MNHLEAQLDQIISEQPHFSGVVLAYAQGQRVLVREVGMANRSEQIPNTITTRFGTASGTKTFTAVAIGQLVAQGRLHYDQPLRTCVDHDLPQIDQRVTIHQLLCHTSGIADYFDEATMTDYAALWNTIPMYRIRRSADFLPLIQQRPMMFAPGERFHYNNAGFVLLGLVIETITGQSLPEYIEQAIFQPAGMHDSGYFASDKLPARTALGYIDDEHGWHTNVFSIPIIGGGDGGAYVTAPDIIAFWQALRTAQILPAEHVATMLHKHAEEDSEYGYGYGIWITPNRNGFHYRMIGGDPGVSFTAAFDPEQDRQIVVIGNVSSGASAICRQFEMNWHRSTAREHSSISQGG
ncbi:MAG: serine hydrolase [Roseiflexaceae bacterium]